jgi:hypothetical protein
MLPWPRTSLETQRPLCEVTSLEPPDPVSRSVQTAASMIMSIRVKPAPTEAAQRPRSVPTESDQGGRTSHTPGAAPPATSAKDTGAALQTRGATSITPTTDQARPAPAKASITDSDHWLHTGHSATPVAPTGRSATSRREVDENRDGAG